MKTPRLFRDLYGDLRDRRLLPVAIVLIVATLAVPFLLSSDDPVLPPAPADPAATTDEMPTMPAVLASNPSLRDYRERLESLREKNPFADDSPEAVGVPAAESAGSAATGDEVETAASAGGVGGAGGSATFSETFSETVESTSGSSSGSTVPEDVTVEVDESGGGSDSGSGGGGGGASGGGGGDDSEPPEDGKWFAYTVDVTTGLAGDLRERKNLQGLTVLPSRSNPVAVYIGVGDGGKEAVFMVSPDVVDSRGDGDCLPSPSNCQYLTLRKNDERRFQYAPSGEPDTYVLVVDDIGLERLKDPPDATRDALDGAAGASVDAFLGS